jgi:hypothetical protein
MLRIEIEPVWRFHRDGNPQSVVVMLGVLNEIRKTGKITSAANDVRLSYRHVWNLIDQWSEFFGVPLVETRRGKGSRPNRIRREAGVGRRAHAGAARAAAGKISPRSSPPRSSRSCNRGRR